MIAIIILGVIITLVILLLYASEYYRNKRQQEWLSFARNHHFTFIKHDSIGLPEKYAAYPLFASRDKRTAMNVCRGIEKEFPIYAFDYFREDRNVGIFRYTVIALESNLLFKTLAIHPKHVVEKTGLGSHHIITSGSDNIIFESAEFSNKFYIHSADKKFAYDIIHPQMMEFLLAHDKMHIELGAQTIIFYRETQQLSTPELDNFLNDAYRFFELIPDYVKEDISIT